MAERVRSLVKFIRADEHMLKMNNAKNLVLNSWAVKFLSGYFLEMRVKPMDLGLVPDPKSLRGGNFK